MANHFYRSTRETEPSLGMSNGGTAVFFDVLSLAACLLAKSDWELRWAIACCDSTRVGMGMDGLALDELPMREEGWQGDREFVLRVIDLASTRYRWDVLGYDPPFALECLATFRELVAGYVPQFPLPAANWRWTTAPIAEAARMCAQHPVFVGTFGECRFCRPDMD